MLTLKQILDELWGDRLVRCPRNITRWIGELEPDEGTPHGLTKIEDTGDVDLFYARGRRVDTELKNSKKKNERR